MVINRSTIVNSCLVKYILRLIIGGVLDPDAVGIRKHNDVDKSFVASPKDIDRNDFESTSREKSIIL